ncbi:NUDIX hydrolase [Microbacterium aquimaris]|uniref:NUDIX domain-containing protein n=1 Tax=Microbacterium aquimaris TaxID=459816 RepID=A0ABU5N5W3_9MICO|nr:NUDIX domain-containing protein [Microbacterium aquimaris]MDZ8161447.1 NUDIX domain-containing protein [Microbacterium aquimaris]
MRATIHVSAAVVVSDDARTLVVRKRGARVFQQPGGKPDPGEDALAAVVREVAEETGIVAAPGDFVPLGRFTDAAANEPGHEVVADAFLLRVGPAEATASGEIEELRWLTEDDVPDTPLANLSRNHLIRFAWR